MHWRSRTSCRKFWWFDNSRSQGPQWQLRISRQSPICSRGAGLGYPMDPVVSVQNKNFTRNPKELAKSSWSRIGSLKPFTLTIPWNLAKLVKIFPGIIVRRHHTDQKQMRLLKEQSAEKKKAPLPYCCNQVWMKIGGWADSMECYTYLRNIQDLLSDGKTPYERRFGELFKRPIIPFGSLVEYHPKTAKDQSRIHQFGKRVLPGLFLGYALYEGRDLEGRRTGRRPWGVGDDGRIGNLLKTTECEGSNISQREWKIYFSSRRWTNQNYWRRSGTENTHLDTGTPNSRRRSRGFSFSNQKGLFHHLKTHFRMPVKR